jgi:hypothetical protein
VFFLLQNFFVPDYKRFLTHVVIVARTSSLFVLCLTAKLLCSKLQEVFNICANYC